MTVEMRKDDQNDQFPVGMRVLAVDDDPICLRLIEGLLRKCQYHVTIRDRAIDALALLRENRDNFDLVISDVQMPDMDGFKLLELVGLEMDLPVIMLSSNGDTKMVMKGITHGACDYLVKPVRLEELKNIWQHVIRRKKTDKKDQTNSDNREKRSGLAGEEQNCVRAGDSDNDGRHSKRRKDQNEDDDDEEEENYEDSSSQKKARVVWSVELHRKFVAAVNQLGFERAVPKKILELMNVEKLSRENVASHLQKYRLYLKRLSLVANQQANMVAALGGADSAYLRMNPTMGFHNFNGTQSFPNNTFRPLPPAGMLGRLNSPAGLSIHGIPPSLGHGQMTDSSKFQLPRDQTGNILQGMPTSLEFDQLQIPLKKSVVGIGGDFSNTNQGNGHFSVSNGNNPLLLQQDHHSSVAPVSYRNTANWSSGAQSTSYGSSHVVGYTQPPLVQGFNSSNNGSSSGLSGANELQIPPNISRFDARCQVVDLSSGGAQNMGYASKPLWSEHKLSTPEFASNSMLSSPIGNQTNMNFGGSNELGFIGHNNPNINSPSAAYHTTAAVPGIGSATNSGALAVNGAGSLEDVVTSMIKWEQGGATVNKGSDMSSYPLRTCI